MSSTVSAPTPGAERHPADRIQRIPDPQEPVPRLAWPVVGLFAGGWALWLASTAAVVAGPLPWWAGTLLNAVAGFVLFTVAHDTAHNSVSTSERVTTWLGRLSTPLFAPQASYRVWRFIHMQHHRFTNHDDGRDPDHYTHSGPAWQLPLRWATVDFWYLRFYLPKFRKRPAAERRELLVQWALMLAGGAALVATGYGFELLVLYLLPARLAVTFLAWSFDWLPHHGLEEHTVNTNKFRATRNRIGLERLLSPLLLNQNYHLVHHLHPRIPFHRYVAVWRRNEEQYLEQGPELTDVRGRPLTAEEYRRLRAMH